ncbi:hypothetical protein GCM10017744_066910 [Streptomyces antimycoticus]|uniref:Uncharacterized protein n=1 Tax=Streptomyces antimycoticus TaxID=68175 RepID=A0A4D4K7B2_9ACTN|nr:hypothetical protein SANT12839_035080 [Streptomyces antimycoticus]
MRVTAGSRKCRRAPLSHRSAILPYAMCGAAGPRVAAPHAWGDGGPKGDTGAWENVGG